METPYEREHLGEGVRVAIYPDESCGDDSPRQWSNVGQMVCEHSRYDLGDRKPEDSELEAVRRGGMALLARYLRRYGDAVGPVLPLGLLDHSGLHMWVGGGSHWTDSAGWDSGTVGFTYATRKQLAECGLPDPQHDGETVDARIARALTQDVETYDQWLRGDVWGYVVEVRGDAGADEDADDADWDEVDACWGIYGSDEAMTEGREAAAGYVEERRAARVEARRVAAALGDEELGVAVASS
jgi:hypothetical protein